MGARFIKDTVTAIDPAAQTIHTRNGQCIRYTVSSVNIGVTSNIPDLPGFYEYGIPAKPIARFINAWTALQNTGHPQIVIIGGGVAGAELAMAMAFSLKQRRKACSITIVERDTILGELKSATRKKVQHAIRQFGIKIRYQNYLTKITQNEVHLEGSEKVSADLIIGTAGASPHPWLANTGLDLIDGYVGVNPHLQTSDPHIFAAGDCAHFVEHPLPNAGVYAVRQAPTLAYNLIAQLNSGTLKSYRPQSDFLKLITLGQKKAVAEKYGFTAEGVWVWHLKNHIDRKFMSIFP